ncbi:hypothetical protein WN943_010916 [Citrus x changshan-huyou]
MKATWNLEVIQKKGKNSKNNQTNKHKRDVVTNNMGQDINQLANIVELSIFLLTSIE